MLTSLREILEIPPTYKLALINGGATAATEFLLWNLLGSKPVDMFVAGVFGRHWYHDVMNELGVRPLHSTVAPIGKSPDFTRYNPDHDCVFVWSDTPSGTVVPSADWIPGCRDGLTICDLTSIVFCDNIPWEKLDAASFSLQKGIGGEGGLGVVVLAPRAVARLDTTTPSWPIPRLYRAPREEGKRTICEDFFQGSTINTVSLLTVSDMLLSLNWAKEIGGLKELINRVNNNYKIVADWVRNTPWVDFLVKDENIRSKNSLCVTVINQGKSADWAYLQKMMNYLYSNNLDQGILNHPNSCPSLRFWLGPVVEEGDIHKMLRWVEEAYSDIVDLCPHP
jgi:phosphoserine aminotransferase